MPSKMSTLSSVTKLFIKPFLPKYIANPDVIVLSWLSPKLYFNAENEKTL